MSRTKSISLCLGVAMLATALPATALAQDDPAAASPEGVEWRLTEYPDHDGLVQVPDGVTATIILEDGTASGSGGCNSFSGSYQIDGSSITIGPDLVRTEMFCEGDPQVVEDAYMASLPMVTMWSIESDTLMLTAQGDDPLLVFTSDGIAAAGGDLAAVLTALEALTTQVATLEERLQAIETSIDENSAPAKPKKPKAPAKKGKVKTQFPDWMRDEFRPEADRSDAKNRETVRWRDRAKDELGYRVYARRGFCTRKRGADATKEFSDEDFKTTRGKRVLIEELPSDSRSYRPDHAAIDAALPEQPVSPYSNDQFYDLLMTTYNDVGESKPVLVGSYFLTPEFRCP